jgi:Protein of unknown function (DUF2796)
VRARALLLSALLASPAIAADKPAAERHPGHRHGAASLQVGVEGRVLQIALEGPADNILGFEHAPKTDAQRKAVARAEEQLKQPDRLFSIPSSAGCQVQPARVEMKLPTSGSRETHSEIDTEWRWDCAKPEALTQIDVALFKVFPRLKELRVQIVTAKGQTAVVLRPGAPRLKVGP